MSRTFTQSIYGVKYLNTLLSLESCNMQCCQSLAEVELWFCKELSDSVGVREPKHRRKLMMIAYVHYRNMINRRRNHPVYFESIWTQKIWTTQWLTKCQQWLNWKQVYGAPVNITAPDKH